MSEQIELAKDQHKELVEKIDEVCATLKALFLVPILLLYMVGIDVAFVFDRVGVAIWCVMNSLVVIPLLGAAVTLILRVNKRERKNL